MLFTFADILLISSMSSIIDLCRLLRKQETPAEKLLWQYLRNRKLNNKKFLRQFAICVQSSIKGNIYYIPDFYCAEHKLVVEADGPIHLLKKDYDQNRDEVLTAMGLRILRFKNEDIINNTELVSSNIAEYL
ncbi:endonuclease domain-containing protein [Mucilaginibacter dorajii]|uniref:endonuclease domain-containing protein n=2 Tax=Mucilaginibacter dorajii TaxID=692994 RepID=UPI0035B59BE3